MTMPRSTLNNHPPLSGDAHDTTSNSNSSTQALLEGSGGLLEIPKVFQGSLKRGAHARSRSVGDSGRPSTTFQFGQRKPSNFAPTLFNGQSSTSLKMYSSETADQAQPTATDSSSIHIGGTQSGHDVDIFRFGQGDNDTPEPVFSFASLHNFTPLPSPRASPAFQSPSEPLRNSTPTLNSSPIARASTPGSFLSPPKFSLDQTSLSSASDITSRVRSLSLAVASSDTRALSATPKAPSDEAINSRRQELSSDADLKPYDPRDEPGPEHEYFTSRFQQNLRDGAAIAKETIAAIGKLRAATELDGEIEQLLDEAKEMSSFRSETTRRVAILGDSGEGKSSLINSLLHFPGLAQTGDIGSACTSVVTEYRHKQVRHTAPITIEVEYLSSDGIEDLLRELLWSYRQLYLPLVESNETSEKEYARFQAESEHAWSALQAAFGHQQRFKKEFLRDMSNGASERALDQLILWSKEIEWPSSGEGGSWTSTALTADECGEKTRIFMQDRLWPFTKLIRVYLSSQILKTGLILADLPGLQDTNLARVRSTQEYLMQCDNVFIVAKIARAITNKSVKSSMYWALSRHAPMEWQQSAGKHLNVSLVCTRSEDINIQTAKREFCGSGKQIPSEVIARLEADIEAAKSGGNRQRKKELKRLLEFLLIRARNEHVKEGVQRAYASEIPDGKLDVFCVSNTLYEKYCRKGNRDYVNASGIPELRRVCHSITAEAQLREAQHYLHSGLASLLNSLGLWAGSRLPTRVEPLVISTGSIESSLGAVKEKAQQSAFQFRQDFIGSFDEQITAGLTKRKPHWDREAKAKASSWETWHWTQYNAWCLRNGNHFTEKRGAVDWNAELIWKMRSELDYGWDIVMEEVADVFGTLRESVAVGLSSLKELILESPKTVAMTSLTEGIDAIIESWKYKLRLAEDRFARGVGGLRRKTLESHSNSYIVNEMTPSYRSASKQTSTGKAARQRGIVGGKVAEGTIFPNIAIRLHTDMRALVEETAHELSQLVTQLVGRLEEDVAMALRVSEPGTNMVRSDEGQEKAIKAFGLEIDVLKAKQSAFKEA